MTTKRKYFINNLGGENIREGVTKGDNGFVFSDDILDWQRSKKNVGRRERENRRKTN